MGKPSKFFSDAARAPIPIHEFESDDTVLEDGEPVQPNVIYIKPFMDAPTEEAVKADYMPPIQLRAGETEGKFHHERMQTALFVHNVVRWEGPDLDGYPCDEQHKRDFPVYHPLRVKVLAAINARNKPPEVEEKPTAPTSKMLGSTPSTAPVRNLWDATTSRQPSRVVSDGSLIRFEDSIPSLSSNS